MMKLPGKVALITGSARGLGKAFTEILLQRGARVSMVDVLEKQGQEASAELNSQYGPNASTFTACDVSDTDKVSATIKDTVNKMGRLDIVVNNAGIGDEEHWSKMVDVNLKGTINTTYEAMKYMRRDEGGKGGLIINVASASGIYANPLLSVYSASKHGVIGFSKSLAMTIDTVMPQSGLRVGCLCPEFTDTAMVDKLKSTLSDMGLNHVYRTLYDEDGVMKVQGVVDAFELLLQKNHPQGGVLHVTTEGSHYIYPKSKM